MERLNQKVTGPVFLALVAYPRGLRPSESFSVHLIWVSDFLVQPPTVRAKSRTSNSLLILEDVLCRSVQLLSQDLLLIDKSSMFM